MDAVGSYQSGGDCRTGSPENPTCTSHLTLNADGRGEFIGDDIVEPVTWTATADRVVVRFPHQMFQLHVDENGNLVENGGTIWTRQP